MPVVKTGGTGSVSTPTTAAAAGTAITAAQAPAVNYNDPQSLEAAATAGVAANVTQAVWATFLLMQLNASGKVPGGQSVPITLNNIHNIERWMVAENPSADWFHLNNPLNASLGTSSSDGTAGYANLSVAGQETAAMLTQSNMSGILDALINDAPAATFSTAVVQSPWASGHYGVSSAETASEKKYAVVGRTVTYLSTIGVPAQVSAGSGKTVLPADPGAANPESDGLPSLDSGVLGELGTLLGDIGSATFWKRIGIFALGAGLTVLGLVVFLSTTKPGQQVASASPDIALAALA